MFHIELRQFPHNLNRFNLDQAGLWAVLEPWVRDRVFELGERRWSSRDATIRVLEGPEIPLQQLSLGRGWRVAERGGEDVTRHVLAQAQEAVAAHDHEHGQDAQPTFPTTAPGEATSGAAGTPASTPGPGSPEPAGGLAAGVELAALLGADAIRLLASWGDVVARAPDLAPSESLALAERKLAESDGPAGSGGEGGS